MATYNLKSFQNYCATEIESIRGTVRLQGKWSDFRDTTREICDHFITLAAASLLADMKPELYFQNLCRSVENWRRYFVSSAQHFSQQPPLLYNRPLYAALAANEHRLLTGLADVMPKQYKKGEEYEDQFHGAWLHVLIALNRCENNSQIARHLAQFEISGGEGNRTTLFKSLLGLEGLVEADFWSAFENASFAYDEDVQGRIESIATDIVQFIPHRYIWFEGVAWLRLAMTKGFTLPSKRIKYCPDETLENIDEIYQNDWLIIPLPH